MPVGDMTHELTPLSPAEKQMLDDNEWIISQSSELESKYAGEYILVCNRQVVAHGFEVQEIFKHAAAAGLPREQLVLFAVPGFVEVPR